NEIFFEMEFDFIDHNLLIECSHGAKTTVALQPKSVAKFYDETMVALREVGVEVHIWKMPVEIADPIPFDQDEQHASYDREYVERFWRILRSSERVMQDFRSRFIGKCSPVHFFWGSFDLAVTRFSGRPAPPRPDADVITREAYSQEVSSVGFWPGNNQVPTSLFYSYAYPSPDGFADAKVKPAAASFHPQLREFVLSYDDVRRSESPEEAILDFAQSTYDAASTLAKWDRAALEEVKPSLHSAGHQS
ncbi:MAG TPA: DUF5996 family protein, partial [Chthoniobacterales bacterium]